MPVLIALMHDILITAGVYALVGREVTTSTVAALLTILGFSLYDTIIVFDRIRENVPRMPSAAFSQIVNRSMSEVIVRSLATRFCTVAAGPRAVPVRRRDAAGLRVRAARRHALGHVLVGLHRRPGAHALEGARAGLPRAPAPHPRGARLRAGVRGRDGGRARSTSSRSEARRARPSVTAPQDPTQGVSREEFDEMVRDLGIDEPSRPAPAPAAAGASRRPAGGRRARARVRGGGSPAAGAPAPAPATATARAADAGETAQAEEAAQPPPREAALMGALVWVMMGLAIWHFTIFLPDRFWGGIVGAFLGALLGAVLFGLAVNGFTVPGRTTPTSDGARGDPGRAARHRRRLLLRRAPGQRAGLVRPGRAGDARSQRPPRAGAGGARVGRVLRRRCVRVRRQRRELLAAAVALALGAAVVHAVWNLLLAGEDRRPRRRCRSASASRCSRCPRR